MNNAASVPARTTSVRRPVYLLGIVSLGAVVAINGYQVVAAGGPTLGRLALLVWAGLALGIAERARRTGLLAVVRGR